MSSELFLKNVAESLTIPMDLHQIFVRANMPVSAVCPECSASAPVPDEMVGKKVRCTKCKAVFAVAAPAPKKAKRPSTASKLPKSKSGSVVVKRPVKKGSGALLWISVLVVLLLAVGGGGYGVWTFMNGELAKDTREAKAKTPKAAPTEKAKEDNDKQAKGKEYKSKQKGEPTPPKVAGEPKKPAPPEVKDIEPVLVAALAASTPVDLKDLGAIRGIFPVGNDLNRVGLHTVHDKEHYFEMYDLKKKTSIAKVKLAPDVELIDIDLDGTVLATETADKRINIYSLPQGGYLVDDSNVYDDNAQKIRKMSELGGKVNYLAMLSKNELFVMSSVGLGDVWDVPFGKDSKFLIQPAPRTTYRKSDVEPNRDFVLSPDRTLLAFATDEGIEFRTPKTGAKLGKTPKLTKFGAKPEIIGMGFEPGGTKLTVYMSAGNDKGRGFLSARFSVPGGDELSQETLAADPGAMSGLEFVNGEHFFAIDRNNAILRDGQGKTVAECHIAVRASLFSPKVVHSTIAYTFIAGKNQPMVGVANVPLGGAVTAPPPPPPTGNAKGKSIAELFPSTPTTPPPTETTKTRTFEQQELWEFGEKGILKKGIKSFEVK